MNYRSNWLELQIGIQDQFLFDDFLSKLIEMYANSQMHPFLSNICHTACCWVSFEGFLLLWYNLLGGIKQASHE